MNVSCDRLGSSLASTWGGPFFGVHKVGAPVELQKASNTFQNQWFEAFSGDPFWGTNLSEKRSHAAWRSFSVFPKRSHAAWRSFSACRIARSVIKIMVLERGARLGDPQRIHKGKLLGCFFGPIDPKAIFLDPNIIPLKPLTVLNKTVSTQRGS